jgi:PiT family inorganic phosphate transporter
MVNNGHELLMIVFCGLIGGILWNLLTWLLGLPSSSSHALFGGLIGSTAAALGFAGVNWMGDGTKLDGVLGKVILPAFASPVVAALVATIGTWLVFRITSGVAERYAEAGFRWGQIGTASLVSLAHGTNDAQKTMGVITLALIAYGVQTDTTSVPLWVKVVCAFAIAAGTYTGGWRIIRTLGKGLVEISSPQGMAAEASSAAVILTSSHLGFALSTTHVATGSILGSGLGRRGAEVRWGVAGRMALAWLITLPAAGIVGALTFWVGNTIPSYGGPLVVFAILLGLAGWMVMHSRKTAVHAGNVNEEWHADSTPGGAVAAAETVSTKA